MDCRPVQSVRLLVMVGRSCLLVNYFLRPVTWTIMRSEAKVASVDFTVHIDSDREGQRDSILLEAAKNLSDEE